MAIITTATTVVLDSAYDSSTSLPALPATVKIIQVDSSSGALVATEDTVLDSAYDSSTSLPALPATVKNIQVDSSSGALVATEDTDDDDRGVVLSSTVNNNYNKSEGTISGKKRRRRRSAINNPLEKLICRGLCGSDSKCLSKRTAEGEEPKLVNCANYALAYKCPLMVGVNCVAQFNSI
jgi:hypothetical protein